MDRLLLIACALLTLTLAGCGLFAAPCRVTSAGLKIVPLIGHPVAATFDACANEIDPDTP
jgi:hypothetical protein